ncbi:hypothetical protein KZX45_01835 [Georgenia sp. EYE_87]|uniref:hypothetical protein n=1 Tax=Georgenia sp. EYE_87 TaxID=2853448 RepID=UPI00200600AE|nr:hypothetical protein [Georgenia sp. EYE_87]MCK6209281.1 hypothetical protein [Georgenia sp. EYE_87]
MVLELALTAPFVFVVLYVVTTCFDVVRDRADTRALARARAGRRVPVPVVVLADGLRRGRAVRDGEDVRIHGRSVSVVLDRAEVAASTVRRGQLDDNPVRWCELRGFVDESGSPVFVGPPEAWEPAYEALVQGPAARAGRLQVLRAAVPRPVVVAGGVALAAALVLQAMWWTGRDDLAAVAVVEATDSPGAYKALSVVTAGGAVALLAAGLGTGVGRARASQRRLRAMRPEAHQQAGVSPAQIRAMTFRELARRVSTLEGWADEAHRAPPAPTGRQVVADAARSPVWWFALPAVALAVLPDDMPGLLRAAILAAAVVMVLRKVHLTLQVWRGWRDVADEPVTSEWDYVLVRGPVNEWHLFLLLGETPHWSVTLGEARHPRAEGRCGVRGELGDGEDVRLVIEGETWIPDSPLTREDAESRRQLRQDLADQLQILTAGGER